MTTLSKRERVDAALKGEAVDRVPVSAWQHFIPAEQAPETLADASLNYFNEFDWDWLKLNLRATYPAEAWGNRYDYNDYAAVLPRLVDGPLRSARDLDKINVLSGTDGTFAEQLRITQSIRKRIGDNHMVQTVFSPLSVLGLLAGRSAEHTIEKDTQALFDGVRGLIEADPQGTHAALDAIAITLGRHAAAALEAGATGVFFAIVRFARQGVLTGEEYAEYGRPYDLKVLSHVQSAAFNVLHICGPKAYFDAVTDYPVHAMNWATLGQHNPTVDDAQHRTKKAIIGGVDEFGVLQTGTPDQVIAEAHTAIRATGGRRFLLTPGCATTGNAPPANLHALRRAADLAPELEAAQAV